MNIAEETLMAYVDGELDPGARSAVETAMRDDPEVSRRVAKHQELRAKIQRAYAAELGQAVPDRLLAAARKRAPASESNVVNLEKARSARRSGPPTWRPIASMAASVLIGVGVGFFLWRPPDSVMIQTTAGALVAGGSLAQSLSSQLAGDAPAASPVQIGLSFSAKSGDYCRTFTISSDVSTAGLACRRGKGWQIRALAQPEPASAQNSEYRTAGSALPPAILSAVEAQINGEPLDRAAEIAARKQGWQAAAQ